MKTPKRIDKSLLDDALRQEIENKLDKNGTIDWSQIVNKPQLADNHWRSPVATKTDLPTTGNEDGDLRLVLDTNEVYVWDATNSNWELIGANDTNVDWMHLQNKPSTFPPEPHTHTEADITDLSKDWSEITNKPSTYPPEPHSHAELHTHSNKTVLDKITETTTHADYDLHMIYDHEVRLTNIESGYSEGHTHDNLTVLDKITYSGTSETLDLKIMEDNATNKADIGHTHTQSEITDFNHTHDDRYYTESEIDTKLATKAEKTTVDGHINNTVVHVTQTDKDNWNAKAKITLSTVQPSDGWWFKEV